MNLIEAFEQGKTDIRDGLPEKTIETWQSKIFFFGDKVFKVYKYEKNSFVDFSDRSQRDSFYEKDFSWNHFFSPSIYADLISFTERDGRWISMINQNADDHAIRMRRIDASSGINDLMRHGAFSVEDADRVAVDLTDQLIAFTRSRKSELRDVFEIGWQKLFLKRLEETRQFGYSAEQYIEKNVTDTVIDALLSRVSDDSYFLNFDDTNQEIAIDNHSDNIYYSDNGRTIVLDVVMTERTWRVADRNFNICRLGVDMAILGRRELADSLYATYKSRYQDFPNMARLVYELYNAFLKGAYLHLMDDHDRAKRYMAFVMNNLQDVKK